MEETFIQSKSIEFWNVVKLICSLKQRTNRQLLQGDGCEKISRPSSGRSKKKLWRGLTTVVTVGLSESARHEWSGRDSHQRHQSFPTLAADGWRKHCWSCWINKRHWTLHPITVAIRDDEYLLGRSSPTWSSKTPRMENNTANCVPSNDIINELIEIEENAVSSFRRNSESQHIKRREEILIELGRKAVVGNNQYTEGNSLQEN